MMDTLAACGDVNRNVLSAVHSYQSAEVFAATQKLAKDVSAHLTPRAGSYHEIFLDKKPVAIDTVVDVEPIYGPTYLPRKFKIAIAVQPVNDVDVLAHCLGFVAIVEHEKVVGYTVTVGGGMGSTRNNTDTYPNLAQPLGFCTPEQAVDVAEKAVLVQRDFGDRVNRKQARLKYTIAKRGIQWMRDQVESRLGYKLQPAREFSFTTNNDCFGWANGLPGFQNYTMWVQQGGFVSVCVCV
jgi:sulfite reductase (NADPH) hemoprotein beta-component